MRPIGLALACALVLSACGGGDDSPGDKEQIAVKVIDDRGNELIVVKRLADAERE